MSDRNTYIILNQLMSHPGWKVLEELWLEEVTSIEDGRDKAAKRGSETAWRYWAGMEKGFKSAIIQPKIILARMEMDEDNSRAENKVADLIQELGEVKP